MRDRLAERLAETAVKLGYGKPGYAGKCRQCGGRDWSDTDPIGYRHCLSCNAVIFAEGEDDPEDAIETWPPRITAEELAELGAQGVGMTIHEVVDGKEIPLAQLASLIDEDGD